MMQIWSGTPHDDGGTKLSNYTVRISRRGKTHRVLVIGCRVLGGGWRAKGVGRRA